MAQTSETMGSPAKLRKLNLGSGNYPLKDHINVDFIESLKPDVVHDLNVVPYPFESGAFDRIFASHVFEHSAIRSKRWWNGIVC